MAKAGSAPASPDDEGEPASLEGLDDDTVSIVVTVDKASAATC